MFLSKYCFDFTVKMRISSFHLWRTMVIRKRRDFSFGGYPYTGKVPKKERMFLTYLDIEVISSSTPHATFVLESYQATVFLCCKRFFHIFLPTNPEMPVKCNCFCSFVVFQTFPGVLGKLA